MDYTFTPQADGNIQIAQGGKVISTTTAGNAASTYGYKAPGLDTSINKNKGGVAYDPATNTMVQQTTTALRTQAAENSGKLDQRLSVLGTNTQKNADNPAPTPTPQGNGITMNEDTARQLFGNDFTGLKSNPDGTYTADNVAMGRLQGTTKTGDGTTPGSDTTEGGVNAKLNSDVAGAKAKAKAQVDSANTTLDGISANSTVATAALIDSIKQTFGARIALMEQSNQKILNGKFQEGIRSGRARYVSGVQDGILSDEEQQGIMRISELQGQMLGLIASAEKARTDQDLDIFNKRMSAINTIDDNLQNEVQNLQKNAYDQLKAMNDKIKAESDAEKQAQADMLTKSGRVAPAVAEALQQYKTAGEQADFLHEYSKQSGIPIDVLMGDIATYNDKSDKAKLDIENIQNEIKNRDASTANSAARLELDKKKAQFNPTQKDLDAVGTYLATHGSKDDVQKVKDDPDFFYFVLKKAQDEGL